MARSNTYNDIIKAYYDTSYLSHYGVKGQKWGCETIKMKMVRTPLKAWNVGEVLV